MKTRAAHIALTLTLVLAMPGATTAQRLEKIGQCKTGSSICQAVFVQGNYAYVSERRSLIAIVNISNPSIPWVEGSATGVGISPLSSFVIDTILYLNNSSSTFTDLSVANPSAPYRLGWCQIPYTALNDKEGIYVKNNIAYVCREDVGITLVDVSNPRLPSVYDSVRTNGWAIDLDFKDTFAFVTGYNPNPYYDSLLVLNAADPHQVREIGSCSVFPYVLDVTVAGNYAYTANWATGDTGTGVVNVVDISNSRNPTVVARVDSLVGAANAVFCDSNYLYVAMSNYMASDTVVGGVRVVDVHDPTHPKVVAGYDLHWPHDGLDVKAKFPYVYVAGRDSFFVFQFTPSGVEEETAESRGQRLEVRITAKPNPFTSYATIPGQEGKRFEMYEVTGRKVGTYKGSRIGEGLTPGVYFLRPESGEAKPLRIVKIR